MDVWMNFTVSSVSLVSAHYVAGIYSTDGINRLTFTVMLNTESELQVATVQASGYPSVVGYINKALIINWSVTNRNGVHTFILSSITNWNPGSCMNQTGISFDSTNCNIGQGSLTYVLIQESYLANRFSGELPLLQNYMSLLFSAFPSSENMLFASVPFVSASSWSTDSQHVVRVGSNDYLGYHCVEQGILNFPSGNKCKFLLINPSYSCPPGKYIQYSRVNGVPKQTCGSCHSSCLTCTYNLANPTVSTSQDCTSCPVNQSIIFSDGMLRGKCLCDDGTEPRPDTKCYQCKYQCLKFSIQAIPTVAGIQVNLRFSQSPLTFAYPLESNMILTFNNKTTTDYQFTLMSQSNFYLFNISSTNDILKECELSCTIKLTIPVKSAVLWNDKILQNKEYSVVLSDLTWTASNSLRALTKATESIMTMAFAANAANYVKVLFQMEQLIEYHKYLNHSLPTNFLKLLIDMTNFQYINVFGVTDIDVYGVVASIFTSDFDNIGDIRVNQYGRGVNFMKNMVECLGSFAAILLLNLIVFGITAAIPCKVPQNYRKHLWDRKLNTLNDNLEGIIMPVSFYSIQQLTYVLYEPQYTFIYVFLTILWVFVIVYPFLLVVYIYHNRHDEELAFNYEDMMMDCNLEQTWTYILYISSYYRRFLVASVINPYIPGDMQLLLILTLNLIIVMEVVIIICNRYYGSKIKIGLKLFFNLILVAIDLALMFGRMNFALGEFCKVAAFMTVIPGLLQSLLKFCEAIYNVAKLYRQSKGIPEIVPEDSGQARQHGQLAKASHEPSQAKRRGPQRSRDQPRRGLQLQDDNHSEDSMEVMVLR